MILLVDNYDSFTYNLAQYLGTFTEVEVLRNDDERLYEQAEEADALVFSPGPGWPADAGKMEAMIKDFAGKKPMLGICLGHQALAETFGGKLRLAKNVMHGKQSNITFETPSCVTILSSLTKCQKNLRSRPLPRTTKKLWPSNTRACPSTDFSIILRVSAVQMV